MYIQQLHLSPLNFLILLSLFTMGVAIMCIKLSNKKKNDSDQKITHPTDAFLLSQLALGTTIIILDTNTLMPIAQTIEDYQKGMGTGVCEKTFWLGGCADKKLERLKTYRVEQLDEYSNQTLVKVSMFISSDFSFG